MRHTYHLGGVPGVEGVGQGDHAAHGIIFAEQSASGGFAEDHDRRRPGPVALVDGAARDYANSHGVEVMRRDVGVACVIAGLCRPFGSGHGTCSLPPAHQAARRDGNGANAGQGTQAVSEQGAAGLAAGQHGGSEFHRQFHHQDVAAGEPEILMLQVPQRAAEQGCAAQEQQRDGDLGDDENLAQKLP